MIEQLANRDAPAAGTTPGRWRNVFVTLPIRNARLALGAAVPTVAVST